MGNNIISIDFINILATVINLLVLFLLVQKFLVKPMHNIIEKRESLIKSQFEEARSTKAEAGELKSKYEDSLKNAHNESIAIVDKARQDAQTEYDRIVREADQTAKNMVKKAHQDIAEEKEQSIKEMKSEIGELIALAVGKIEEEKVSPESDKKLIDKFLADMDKEEK